MARRKTRDASAKGPANGGSQTRHASSRPSRATGNPRASGQNLRQGVGRLSRGPQNGPSVGGDPEVTGALAEHDRALDELGGQVDSLLARQEWILSGLYDLNLSLTELAHSNGTTTPPLTQERRAYFESVRAIREAVRRILPRSATVVVVSKGDDALIDLYGRDAWHFPQASDGRYLGHYLPDGSGLIAHLEVMRARGAQYLLFPRSSLWWLDSYWKFARHVQRHYPLVLDEPNACAIYSLERSSSADPSAWRDRILGLVEDYVAEFGTEPSILDWNTGLRLGELLPEEAVFSPPTSDHELPYLDKTADIVVLFSSDERAAAEARRVARHKLVTLDALERAEGTRPPQGEPLAVSLERLGDDSRPTAASTSIVIPTYNGWEHLGVCLDVLEETLPEPFEGEVIVVDDASGERTKALLREWESAQSRLNLKVVENRSNSGFTESCNRGAATAHGEFLVFLNDDTVPQPGWLSALLRTFPEHPEAGAVGGKLLYPDGSLQEAGNVIFSDGSGANFGRGDYVSDDPLYSYVREVDYCSAALLATPRALFEEIGGFDDRYRPAYYEDTDYCFSVWARKHRVLYQPDSVVVHTEGATSGTDLSRGVKRHQVVNRSKFTEKWKKALALQPSPVDRYDFRTWHMLATRRTGS
jgi:GT2 family glycosyltransferase